jgi:hypothetical protein
LGDLTQSFGYFCIASLAAAAVANDDYPCFWHITQLGLIKNKLA